ncbi:A-kinase-interacting protein 1 isoform X2 [Echinops telfairi]|uniref:A-kinase-interacting protein 1 isoform X2 n=1 Tax=Echinops telfairi TaxID=9371 RepID=A0AC55D5I6_ECHTE|nr:A-kinase-interacting protein 1 isoform X2 [Echinops telfairi]
MRPDKWRAMEDCLAAAALTGLDRRSLQRSARLGQEVLERAKRRAVNWHSVEPPKGSATGPAPERPLAPDPQRLPLAEKYYSSVPEDGGATHVSRYHRGKSELSWCSDSGSGQRQDAAFGLEGKDPASQCDPGASHPAESISKDLYIEVYPGTYSVTVGASDFTKKTHVVAVGSGQSVDLVFPI